MAISLCVTSVLSCVISAKCRKRANVKVATFSAKLFPRGQYFHGEKKVDHVTRRILRPLTCPDWFADCYLQHPIHLQLSNFVFKLNFIIRRFPRPMGATATFLSFQLKSSATSNIAKFLLEWSDQAKKEGNRINMIGHCRQGKIGAIPSVSRFVDGQALSSSLTSSV